MTGKDKRRDRRLELTLPVRTVGYDPNGDAWDEMASTIDISVRGCATTLKHKVRVGQVLQLSMPFPRQLRQYELTDASYTIYAIVRWIFGSRIGMLFHGKYPPKGYSEDPAGLHLPPANPSATTVRESPRFDVRLEIRLRRTSPAAGQAREEMTITETLGEGGAGVLTSLPVVKGERVEVEALHGPLQTNAEVVSVSVGDDHIPRLNLRFLDEGVADLVKATLRSLGIFVGGPAEPPPSASAATTAEPGSATAGLRIDRSAAFRECLGGKHELCVVGLAEPAHDRFRVCACTCHGA